MGKRRRQRIAVFQTGFRNFPSQTLLNLGCFGNGASLGYQAWNIRACDNIATFFQWLYMQSNGYLVHINSSVYAMQTFQRRQEERSWTNASQNSAARVAEKISHTLPRGNALHEASRRASFYTVSSAASLSFSNRSPCSPAARMDFASSRYSWGTKMDTSPRPSSVRP
jgi:hypothetical protein